MSAYDSVVKKYAKPDPLEGVPLALRAQPTSDKVTLAPAATPKELEGNPYAGVVSKYATQKRQASFDASQSNADAGIANAENPGIYRTIVDTAKGIPAAVGQIAKEAVTHPVRTAQSTLLGLMDVGPAIANTLNSVGKGIIGATGADTSKLGFKLPLPGQTFSDYIGTNDVQQSVGEGAKQFGAYELGGAMVPAPAGSGFFTKAASAAAGNVIGGQAVAPEGMTLKERAQQAAFDAAFGILHTTTGSVLKTLRDTKASIPGEVPKIETPKGEAPAAAPKVKITAPEPHLPDVAYAPKKSLGVDASGNKILATTEYSTKTGKAIVYYAKELDSNPELRTTVLDHESGHIMDKRVNEGRNLSASLQNPMANEETLRNVLGPFARQTDKTIQQAATELAQDIETLSKGVGHNPQEKFANAYAQYRQDPIAAAKDAPAFDSFMKHTPIEKVPVIQSRSVTAETLKPKKPKAQGIISARKAAKDQLASTSGRSEKLTKKVESKVNPRPTPANVEKAARKMTNDAQAAGKPVIIDPDALKKVFNDFDPKNHEKYSTAAKAEFATALKKNKNPEVVFTAGGSGSGKSEFILKRIEQEGHTGIVYDGTMADYSSSIAKIRQAAAAGKTIRIDAILPRIESAWKFVQKRALKTGRGVPLEEFVKKHVGFIKTLEQLVKDGYDVRLLDTRNTFKKSLVAKQGFVTDANEVLARLGEVRYNESKLLTELQDVKLSKTTKERVLNKANKAGSPVEAPTVRDRRLQQKALSTDGGGRTKLGRTSDRIRTGDKGRVGEVVKTAPAKLTPTATPGTGRIAATGLRTSKGVNTKSFNASKIDAPDDVHNLFEKMGGENKNFASQRLSKGNEDIKDLARLTGLSEDELLAAKPGSIANSETVTAARQLVLNKAQGLMDTLKGIDVSTASPEQLKTIRDDFVKLVSMQKAVAGFRTEASNVFRSLGLELAPGENATLEELAGLLKQAGVASEEDAAVFSQKVAQQMTLTKLDKVREGVLSTWYAAILSGPKTTVRNVLSTGSNILTEIAAKASNPKQWKEVMPALTGLVRGLKMGLGEAREVLKGAPDTGKFVDTGRNVTQPAIFTGKAATYGTIVESVGRFLNAQDKLLSAGAREMERASLKARGLEVSKAVEDAITKSYAERTVYHGRPTGKFIAGLRDAAQALRKKYPASKFVIPFVDTVANVMDRQFDYVPITGALRLKKAVVADQASRIIKDYGLKESDRAFIEQRIFDQQVGRLALGSIVSTGAILLAGAGNVSGSGPTNTSERQELMRTGWRPNSIKLGDTWIPYTYLGPLAGILSMAGNVHDKVTYDKAPSKDVTSLIGNGLVGWTQTQLNASFLSGVSDLFDVATGNLAPATYIKNFATGLIPIPAAYSQTKDMIFRQQYQTHGIVEAIRLKLGLTEGLQPKIDQFGEPMTSDLIFGISPSSEQPARVERFLIANDIPPVTIPSQSTQYSIPGTKEKRKLTPEEYTAYVHDSGVEIYKQLSQRLPGLQNMPADQQKKEVQNLVDKIRTRVRGQVMMASKK